MTTSTDSNKISRFAWVRGLHPEKAENYRELHAHPWPEVNATIPCQLPLPDAAAAGKIWGDTRQLYFRA